MRTCTTWASLVFGGLIGLGCGGGAAGWEADAEPIDAEIITASSGIRAAAVLAFVNDEATTFELLDIDVGLDARAARGIARHGRFYSLAQLDAVPYVGQKAFDLLDAHVRDNAPTPGLTIEDVELTPAEANAMVLLSNSATEVTLDDAVDLDARAARGIVNARPIRDIEELAAASYVGTTALTKLRDYVRAPAPSPSAWDDAARDEIGTFVATTTHGTLEPFSIPPSAMPAAARDRVAASSAVLEVPTTYQMRVQNRSVFVVLATDGSGEGGTVVLDLVDDSGRWFGHGIAHALWDGGGGFSWSLEAEDPTLCGCAAAAPATCVWMDGTTAPSQRIECEPN